jgi:hypothetical protein
VSNYLFQGLQPEACPVYHRQREKNSRLQV